MYQFNNYMLGK